MMKTGIKLQIFAALVASVGLATLGCAAPVLAQTAPAAAVTPVNAKAAEAFIKQLSDQAFGVLRDKSLGEAQRENRFRELLKAGFALDKISTAVLGKNKRTATPEQLANFDKAFPDYVIRIYANRLTEFSDTKIAVAGSVPAGSRGDVAVKTLVSGKNLQAPVKADWRVTQVPGVGLRIVDLSFEGISMVATQRDEFDAKIAQKGMNALIADLGSNKPGTAVKVKAK
jgi:phospholipid transport system substrate-binding protein